MKAFSIPLLFKGRELPGTTSQAVLRVTTEVVRYASRGPTVRVPEVPHVLKVLSRIADEFGVEPGMRAARRFRRADERRQEQGPGFLAI